MMTTEQKEKIYNYYRSLPVREGKKTIVEDILKILGTSFAEIREDLNNEK